MELTPLLTVDEQRITLNQAIGYLQTSGKLGAFIGDILRQHILEQELPALELNIASETIEHIIHNLRNEHQRSTPELFEQWLTQNGTTYGTVINEARVRLARLEDNLANARVIESTAEERVARIQELAQNGAVSHFSYLEVFDNLTKAKKSFWK